MDGGSADHARSSYLPHCGRPSPRPERSPAVAVREPNRIEFAAISIGVGSYSASTETL